MEALSLDAWMIAYDDLAPGCCDGCEGGEGGVEGDGEGDEVS